VSHTLGMGTILVEQGTALPDLMNVRTEPYDLGWSAITNLTRSELGRQLVGAGWNFFYMAGELRKTGFGFDEQSRIHQAITQLIKSCQRETFNCLEITQVTRKSFLGVPRTQVCAHGRHIQVGPFFHPVSRAQP
jgi:hypothetical protein